LDRALGEVGKELVRPNHGRLMSGRPNKIDACSDFALWRELTVWGAAEAGGVRFSEALRNDWSRVRVLAGDDHRLSVRLSRDDANYREWTLRRDWGFMIEAYRQVKGGRTVVLLNKL
jgi:hypothetical protein